MRHGFEQGLEDTAVRFSCEQRHGRVEHLTAIGKVSGDLLTDLVVHFMPQ